MSIQYCESCDQQIDTDFNLEHFEECGMDKHTKGPWFHDWSAKKNGAVTGWHVGPQIAPLDEMGSVEPLISIPNEFDEAEDVARLVAAAPELLEALEEAVSLNRARWEKETPDNADDEIAHIEHSALDSVLTGWEAAIAKARDQQ